MTGHTAVHKAAYYDYPEVIRTLSSYGADLNVKDEEGHTPLSFAFLNFNAQSILVLIECGADFNQETKAGMLPLLEASLKGFHKCVRAILERGGNVNATNSTGNTALHLAASEGHTAGTNITYLSKAEQLDLLMVFKTVITAILGFSPNLMAKNNAGFTAADLGKLKFVRF